MKIKRLAASINAYFDDFVSKVENHDAVAKVAIEDVQKAAARIRSEKNKIDQRLKQLNEEKNQQEICCCWSSLYIYASYLLWNVNREVAK